MLPRASRLHRASDTDRVFRRGFFAASTNLTFKWLPNPTGQTRVAFLVGKKLAKTATARNRIKRRLRAALATQLPELPAGLDLLVLARTLKLAENSFGELLAESARLISTLQSKCKNSSTSR